MPRQWWLFVRLLDKSGRNDQLACEMRSESIMFNRLVANRFRLTRVWAGGSAYCAATVVGG